jgi:5-methylcytosine-specific restriction endonuclease McrA
MGLKDAEARRAWDAAYYQRNRERILTQKAAYYVEHREERQEYKARNREQIRAARLKYNSAHREENARYTAEYRRAHPEAHREAVRNHRNRKRANGGTFSLAAWEHLKALFGHCCAYCKEWAETLTQDHVVPLSKAGWHFSGNIVPACPSCNSSKKDRFL